MPRRATRPATDGLPPSTDRAAHDAPYERTVRAHHSGAHNGTPEPWWYKRDIGIHAESTVMTTVSCATRAERRNEYVESSTRLSYACSGGFSLPYGTHGPHRKGAVPFPFLCTPTIREQLQTGVSSPPTRLRALHAIDFQRGHVQRLGLVSRCKSHSHCA